MNKDEQSENRKPQPQGNWLAIFLLIIPIGSLIWSLRTKIVFPINQLDFLIQSSQYIVLAYIILWVLSYHQERGKNNKTLYAVSAFMLVLWFIAGLATVAKINVAWDESPEKIFYVKAIESRKLSGGQKPASSGSCLVTFDKEILGVDHISVRYNECDDIQPNVDGLQIHVKEGYLGFPWMADHSIVKDIEFYKRQLGIKDTQQ
ncbi:MAG: hypothetical protein A3B66_06380 [Alphaproteobacteria bacterium RIFCSPHIGHO2_02_FULL_46_13]|nr:MAG: hypothetical protein A3B66_06380 [Alphaproteobacteria bacterium RIFCSPHIGHO2_02_FULL_46_13]